MVDLEKGLPSMEEMEDLRFNGLENIEGEGKREKGKGKRGRKGKREGEKGEERETSGREMIDEGRVKVSEGTFSMINRILVWLVWYQWMDKSRGVC